MAVSNENEPPDNYHHMTLFSGYKFLTFATDDGDVACILYQSYTHVSLFDYIIKYTGYTN